MANEAVVTVGLRINNPSESAPLKFNDIGPPSFSADVTGSFGPTPGSISVATTGTNIDLTQLGTPGFCVFYNQGTAFNVEIGIYDTESQQFYPFMLIKPGEKYQFRLSANVESQFGPGTGSGTTTTRLRARGLGGTGKLFVGAFEA